jgi:hypothetical protein
MKLNQIAGLLLSLFSLSSLSAGDQQPRKWPKDKADAYLLLLKDMEKSAFDVISRRPLKEEFKPGAIENVRWLRNEVTGFVDFLFTSKDGKYTGDAFCSFQELLSYDAKSSKLESVCPRVNVHHTDPLGLNNIGKQVGIY